MDHMTKVVLTVGIIIVLVACAVAVIGAIISNNGPSPSLDEYHIVTFREYVDEKYPEGTYRATYDITLSGTGATLYVIHKDGSVLGSINAKVGKNSYAVYLHHPDYIDMKMDDISGIRL